MMGIRRLGLVKNLPVIIEFFYQKLFSCLESFAFFFLIYLKNILFLVIRKYDTFSFLFLYNKFEKSPNPVGRFEIWFNALI